MKQRTYSLKQIEQIAETNDFSLTTETDYLTIKEITISAHEDTDPFGVFKRLKNHNEIFTFQLYLP